MELTAEQHELQSSIRKLLERTVTPAFLRKCFEAYPAQTAAVSTELEQLGLEEYFAATDLTTRAQDLALLAEETGRVLCPEPVVEMLLARALLPALSAGAFTADVSAPLSITAQNANTTLRLPFVPAAVVGKSVLFRTATTEPLSLGLATIESAELDLCLDRTVVRHTVARSTKVTNLPEKISSKLFQLEQVAIAASMLGTMSKVLELTVEYVKTRKQFSQPIGSFQAVQHQAADMLTATESLRSLVRFAAWAIDASPEQSAFSSQAALNWALKHGSAVCERAIQLHGGIGFTWEHDLHFYLRRAVMLEALYRPTDADYTRLVTAAAAL